MGQNFTFNQTTFERRSKGEVEWTKLEKARKSNVLFTFSVLIKVASNKNL